MLARARSQVNHVVGAADGLLVVLDDQHGVAQVAQRFQRFQQLLVVARVQANRGLIQHVQHAAQPRADLRGQPYALPLAAAERGRRAVQRQIPQADAGQKAEALANLRHHAAGNLFLALVELDAGGRLHGAADAERGKVRNAEAVDAHGQALRTKPPPLAHSTGRGAHVLHQVLAIGLGAHLVERLFVIGEDALEARARAPRRIAIEQELLLLLTQRLEGLTQADAFVIGGLAHHALQGCRARAGAEAAVKERL